jgi:methionyl-tRNA synthetase
MSRILVTSALPYINGIKHLGNLIGSMLPADVYSRFQRQRGNSVLFICATDEHGTPAELAATEAGLEVEEYCRQQHELQVKVYDDLHLSFDYFGRTSSIQNIELTRHLCQKLEEHGFIEEKEIDQVYCPMDKRFLPDRYIVGNCPHCGYELARGDQCEHCATLLDPTDLINPYSAISGSRNLEIRKTQHLFLKQSLLAHEVGQWIDSKTDEWPILVTSIAKKWLKEGLRDRCITRDLSWGVPVDRPGYEGKVFYVWFDAPIGYISATKQWSDERPSERDWKSWWFDASNVKYVQFMAKDNIPFHTVSFPCTLLGSREPWKMVDFIKGFNWLNYYGGKFSTSRKRGIFLDKALEEFPSDYWRYWLLANAPESTDSTFTFESFASIINKDLADIFGNFINRCLKLTASKFGTHVPKGGDFTQAETHLAQALSENIGEYERSLENIEFRKATAALRSIWSLGNNYFADSEPWAVIKSDKERAACILRTSINLIRLFALFSWPVIPQTSNNILNYLHLDSEKITWPSGNMTEELQFLKGEEEFSLPLPLFTKITKEEVEKLEQKYGGG